MTVFHGDTAGFILWATTRCPAPGLTDKNTDDKRVTEPVPHGTSVYPPHGLDLDAA